MNKPRRLSVLLASIVLVASCLVTVAASAFFLSGTQGVTCNGVDGGTPTISAGHGLIQHPEFVLIFWQDSGPSGNQWTNGNTGNGGPTMTQIVGDVLSLTNSPYFATLSNYGGNGLIARPRMAATVPLVTGTPSTSSRNGATCSAILNRSE
jgi:hypothetical protein